MALYTPFIESNVNKIVQAGQQAAQSKLAQSAYMGDPEALGRLYGVNPQLADQIKQRKAQEQQMAIAQQGQAMAAQKEQQQEQFNLSKYQREQMEKVKERMASMSYEQAAEYGMQEAQAIGVTPPRLTPEIHEQIKAGYLKKENEGGGIGKYNPGDYTPSSWAKFIETKDPKVLTRYEASQSVLIGGVPHVFDKISRSYIRAPAVGGGQEAATITPELVASSKETIEKGTKYGGEQGKMASSLIKQADEWEANRGFIVDSIPGVADAMAAAPGSSLSKVLQTTLGKTIGNMAPADAQAEIEQFAAILLQGVPFAPGPQSDKDLISRANLISSQMESPNITPSTKLKLLGNYLDWNDARANKQRQQSSKTMGSALESGPDQEEQRVAPARSREDILKQYGL